MWKRSYQLTVDFATVSRIYYSSCIESSLNTAVQMESKQESKIRATPFVLWHSTILCLASYEANPAYHICDPSNHPNNFTSCSISAKDGAFGDYLVCDAVDDIGNAYFFVCFRGTNDLAKESGLIAAPTVTSLGAIHSSFLSRSSSFPLFPIQNAIQRGCRVILTGHSLGGACAIVLATRFFNKYGQYSFEEGQITCVTFGSPLVGNAAVGELMGKRVMHFHNFIHESDFVPLSLTPMHESTPVFALPSAVASATSGIAVDMAAAVVAALVVELVSYTPFGQFYKIRAGSDSSMEELAPLTAIEVSSYFSVETLRAKFDPTKIANHSMVNYKSVLWPSTLPLPLPMPIPPGVAPPASSRASPPLPPACPQSIIHSCVVKGDTVTVRGAGLAYSTHVTLLSWQLPLSSKHSCTDEKAVFLLSFANQQLEKLRAELAMRATTRVGTEVTVTDLFDATSSPTEVYVAFVQPEEYLSPGKVLSCVLPLATLLIRDSATETQQCFVDMLRHSHALADALPIEFAFRSLENDSADNDMTFLKTFVNRLANVRLRWEDVCSHAMVDILEHTVNELSTKSTWFRTAAVQNKLKILREALRLRQYDAKESDRIEHNLRQVDHAHVRATLLVGQIRTQRDFWKLMCNHEQGISFSVDLFADSECSIRHLFPIVGKDFSNEGGFTISTEQVVNVDDDPRLEAWSIKILHNATQLERHFMHFSCMWGRNELPDESVLTALVEEIRDAVGVSLYLRGTNLRQPCVYLSDDDTGSRLRTGLFAFCLMQKMAHKLGHVLDVKKHTDTLSDQLCDPGQKLPLESAHFTFAENCKMIKRRTVGTVLRSLRNAFVSEGDNLSEAIIVLQDHLYQMKNHYRSVYADAICGKSVTMPVCKATDLNAEKSPFLDLFPKQLTAQAVQEMTENNQQALVNLAHESYTKASHLTIMLEDAMTFGKKVIETERETGVLFGVHCALAVARCIALTPYAAIKAVAAAVKQDTMQMVDVEAAYANAWHNAFYKQLNLSTYRDIVDEVCMRLGFPTIEATTLVEKESFIVCCLPHELRTDTLQELIHNHKRVFWDERFTSLLQGRSKGLMIFFLKTIYHCSHLRRLRKEITLVTIAGEKNAGKTTLNYKIFGEDVVSVSMGTGTDETTIYPSAYNDPRVPDLVYCDLPGSTDSATAEMSDMFLTLGDVTVFVLDQRKAPNPIKGDVLYEILSKVLNHRGPRLICINQADKLLKKSGGSKQDPKTKVTKECDKWRSSALFGAHLANRTDLTEAQWECEKGDHAAAIVASIRSPDCMLSIWFTSFHPKTEVKSARAFLFNADDVHTWVREAAAALKTAERELL